MKSLESSSLSNTANLDAAELNRYFDFLITSLKPRRDDRIPVVYFSPSIEYVGHICQETHAIKYLFDPLQHQLFLISHRPKVAINQAILDVSLRGFATTFLSGRIADWNFRVSSTCLERGLSYRYKDFTFLFGGHAQALREAYQNRLLLDGSRATFTLTPEEMQRRTLLLRRHAGDEAAKIAVLHVRSPGYWSSRYGSGDEINAWRNANIDNYATGIRYLIDCGYYVVRIGSREEQACSFVHERFLDAAAHPEYEAFMDVAFTSAAEIFIHGSSGPRDLACGFGVPLLGVNAHYSNTWTLEPNEIFLARRYCNRASGMDLSVPEIINLDLCFLWATQQFDALGVELPENTPDTTLNPRLLEGELLPLSNRSWRLG